MLKIVVTKLRRSKATVLIASCLSIGLAACIEEFRLEDIEYKPQLVVEGIITDELKRHRVSISTSAPLGSREFIPETKAVAWIEDTVGNNITLSEIKPGIYETPVFSGIVGNRYRLSIITNSGNQYVSDFMLLDKSPAIDSVYATFAPSESGSTNGIHIFLDSRGDKSFSKYYRWEIIETFEIETPFPSNYEWLGGNNVIFRNQRVDQCWRTDTLSQLLIQSTENRDKNEIVALPIRFIEESSYIFRVKYSILARQYSVSLEAFKFWENLRTLSENQGSLSDVQPGNLPSNIKCVNDPDELVLGYFEASSVSEKRTFFSYQDFVDDGYKRPSFRSGCYDYVPEEVPELEIGEYMQENAEDMRIFETLGSTPAPIYFLLMPAFCCDCTDLGENIKPDFWED